MNHLPDAAIIMRMRASRELDSISQPVTECAVFMSRSGVVEVRVDGFSAVYLIVAGVST